jgi:hypothetical protein
VQSGTARNPAVSHTDIWIPPVGAGRRQLGEAMNKPNDAADCAGAEVHAGRPATAETSILERQIGEECIARRAPGSINRAGERTDMLMTIGSGPRRSMRLARPPSPGQSEYTVLAARFPRRLRHGRA